MTSENVKTDGGPAVAPSRLSQIRNDLQQELDCAEGNLARLKEQLSAAERDHKAIKDAVAALSKRGGSSTRKPTVKQGSRPCFTICRGERRRCRSMNSTRRCATSSRGRAAVSLACPYV